MPEIAEQSPSTDSSSRPFGISLQNVFKEAEAAAKQPETTEAKPLVEKPKKEPEAKVETPKSDTPRELFKKPAKEGEKPAEQAEPKSAIDEIAEPVFKDAKGKAGWEAIKKEAKAHEAVAKANEAKARELEAKLAEYEPLKTQLFEREKQISEMSEVVARARIEELPEFRREFIDGRSKIIDRAKAIIEESGGDPKAVETALNLKGKPRVEALREVSTDLDSFQSARLGRAIDELNDLDERASAKRENAKQSYEQMQKEQQQREIEARTNKLKNRLTEFEDTVRKLRGEYEVLNKAEGHDAWSARAEKIVSESRAAVEANPDTNIRAEILARTNDAFRDLFLQADDKVAAYEKENAELKAELKGIHGKSPSLDARGGAAKDTDSKRPFMSKLHETLGGEE